MQFLLHYCLCCTWHGWAWTYFWCKLFLTVCIQKLTISCLLNEKWLWPRKIFFQEKQAKIGQSGNSCSVVTAFAAVHGRAGWAWAHFEHKISPTVCIHYTKAHSFPSSKWLWPNILRKLKLKIGQSGSSCSVITAFAAVRGRAGWAWYFFPSTPLLPLLWKMDLTNENIMRKTKPILFGKIGQSGSSCSVITALAVRGRAEPRPRAATC